MSISSRLSKIEGQLKPASKGHLIYWTDDQETYFSGTKAGQRIDYRDLLVEADPTPEKGYSKQELEALEQDGWTLIIIQYTSHSQEEGINFPS